MYCFAEYAGGGGMIGFLIGVVAALALVESLTTIAEHGTFSTKGSVAIGLIVGFAGGALAFMLSMP